MGRTKRRRDGSLGSSDEPRPEGEEWAEYGGELIWVAGHTEGGVPYGLTVGDFRRANAEDAPGASWARAKYILGDLLELSCGPETRADVGFVRRIGQGMSRDSFAAEVRLTPDPSGRSGDYLVQLPHDEAEPELDVRTRKELLILGRLETLDLPFRAPSIVGAYPESGRLVLVRRFLPGSPLDLRAGRQPRIRPWEIIGEVAAGIHSLNAAHFEDIVPGHLTRREHAEELLCVFDGLDAPEALDAHAWVEAHLPPPEPSVLVHGDLLGQNILLGIDEPPGVIDWEYAVLGDPACDLAVVTRGAKQPFQVEHGLDKLLESYRRHGGRQDVTREHVRARELCMIAGWYRAALADTRAHLAEDELARLRRLLARAQQGS